MKKKQLESKKLGKKLLFFVIFAYIIYVFIGQQKILDSYKGEQKYYSEQLSKQLAYQESLYCTSNNINSKEYIEEIAREKLDMYLPNERVYIDKGN